MKALILDTETHDLEGLPIEIAYVPFYFHQGAPIVEETQIFDEYFSVGQPISFAAMAVHHILESDIAGKPSYKTFKLPEPETAELEDSDSPLDVMYFGNEWSTVLNPHLLDVVYHYSASFNSARGSVSYDGVITFPGRITGIEDYRKVRAEIAKNGNVTPDQVNVHSLTIVG